MIVKVNKTFGRKLSKYSNNEGGMRPSNVQDTTVAATLADGDQGGQTYASLR